jgi:PilZ domain
MRRFCMKLPASVRVSGIPSEFATETENVSSRGLFFYLDRWMTEGARVEVTLNFPSEITLANSLHVRCIARVVRVEPKTPTRTGVAAMIYEYEFMRPENPPQASPGMEPGWHSAP